MTSMRIRCTILCCLASVMASTPAVSQLPALVPVDPLEANLSDREKEWQERRAANQNMLNDWLSGKFSPAQYKVEPSDGPITRLQKQRINAAMMELDHFKKLQHAGVSPLDEVTASQQRLLEAQLDYHTVPGEIVSVLQAALKTAEQTETIVKSRFDDGADVTWQQVAQATGNRLKMELELRRAKKKLGLANPPQIIGCQHSSPQPLRPPLDLRQQVLCEGPQKYPDACYRPCPSCPPGCDQRLCLCPSF
jgi:hypothetical protein